MLQDPTWQGLSPTEIVDWQEDSTTRCFRRHLTQVFQRACLSRDSAAESGDLAQIRAAAARARALREIIDEMEMEPDKKETP